MGGNLDKINAVIDAKLARTRVRKISQFEKFIKTRIGVNPRVLNLAKMEVSPAEATYMSQHPALSEVETLDLRQNFIGDEGLLAICESPVLTRIRELDLRNNQVTRIGLEFMVKSGNFASLQKLDIRSNRLGGRWREKLLAAENLPALKEIKVV